MRPPEQHVNARVVFVILLVAALIAFMVAMVLIASSLGEIE